MNLYNIALKRIENSGIRPTKQRRVLAKILFDKGNRHLSAEELDELDAIINAAEERADDETGGKS